jgi:7-carboxy-7-deazaguanine synthase
MKYRVAEKFISINGEGNNAGQLAVFIRFGGCNLRCSYCDTFWAVDAENVEYQELSGQEIYNYIIDSGVRNVTLTGGEPLFQEGIYELLHLISNIPDLRVEIETNGSLNISDYKNIKPGYPVFTTDYKLGTSGMECAMKVSNFEHLEKKDTVKFVVGSVRDLESANKIIKKYSLTEKCSVHLSPVSGNIKLSEIVEFMKYNKMNGVRLQPQLHKFIWDPNARGV